MPQSPGEAVLVGRTGAGRGRGAGSVGGNWEALEAEKEGGIVGCGRKDQSVPRHGDCAM